MNRRSFLKSIGIVFVIPSLLLQAQKKAILWPSAKELSRMCNTISSFSPFATAFDINTLFYVSWNSIINKLEYESLKTGEIFYE